MHTTYAYEAATADRRHRYEGTAARRRLLGRFRTAPNPAAPIPLGVRSSGIGSAGGHLRAA